MENWMYKCELCTTARFSVVDKGEVWFIDCGSCRSLQFHHKVTVAIMGFKNFDANRGPIYYGFQCKMDKEVEDDKEK